MEKGNSTEDFKINYEIILTIRGKFKEIFPNFNPEEELKKQEMKELSKKIFVTNIPFTKEEKDKLKSYLKDKSNQGYFLICLSKQRSGGKFSRTEKLVKELEELLLLILDCAEATQDYVEE